MAMMKVLRLQKHTASAVLKTLFQKEISAVS